LAAISWTAVTRSWAVAAESIPDGAAPDLFLQRREVLLAGVIRASWR
jgi:hypothetical protein